MMSYLKADEKMIMMDRMKENLKKFYFSNGGVADLFGTASNGTLQYLDGFLMRELERRDETRKSRIIRSAGFPTIKSLDDYCFKEARCLRRSPSSR